MVSRRGALATITAATMAIAFAPPLVPAPLVPPAPTVAALQDDVLARVLGALTGLAHTLADPAAAPAQWPAARARFLADVADVRGQVGTEVVDDALDSVFAELTVHWGLAPLGTCTACGAPLWSMADVAEACPESERWTPAPVGPGGRWIPVRRGPGLHQLSTWAQSVA